MELPRTIRAPASRVDVELVIEVWVPRWRRVVAGGLVAIARFLLNRALSVASVARVEAR